MLKDSRQPLSVTGYFHHHSFPLDKIHESQYIDQLTRHTAIAFEGFGYTKADAARIRKSVIYKNVAAENDISYKNNPSSIDFDNRLNLISSSNLQDAFYLDWPYMKSKEEGKLFDNLLAANDALIEALLQGMADTKEKFSLILNA